MATLILTTVGTLIGGPIGGALGAIVGQQVDNRLFAPKGRRGPRLNELAVQSSAYGSVIPKLFGTSRVAGTVIWATDLKETRRKVSNGKGQPKSTVYSYSASFAVALSARRIVRVGRIWADGNLLRGASGDFKSETGFRLHDGSEGQPVDPLIASAEGMAATPAYRGLAYAVFEDLQLGDFGNRIPALSFEVVADDDDVSIGAILSGLGGTGLAADIPARVGGFAATGDSVRGVAETLADLFPFAARDDGAVLRLESSSPVYGSIAEADLGGAHDQRPVPRIMRGRQSGDGLPSTLSVAHYEPARDYQQGLQRVRGGVAGRRDLRIDMPVTLDAGRAKGHAAAALHRLRVERMTAKIRLPWRYLDLVPGNRIVLPEDPGDWRVTGVTLDRMVVETEIVRSGAMSAAMLESDPGRSLAQPDAPHGPTIFHLLDLPPLDDSVATAPRVAVAAAGALPGWRRAALLVSLDDGMSWQEAGTTAAPAVIGTARTALGTASAQLLDHASVIEIQLLNEAMEVHSVTPDALMAGANVALVGNELVQFRDVMPLGGNAYRLTGFFRGRRGTEWAIRSHQVGEPFVLIEREALAFIDVPAGANQVRVIATGMADVQPPEHRLGNPGQALLPPAPVHGTAVRLSNGDIDIRWVRRSRNGWRWLDGVDVPLVEEGERYHVALTPDHGLQRVIEQAESRYLYSVAAQMADRADGATQVIASISQLGSFGLSRAVSIPFSLG
jgi:hypothetical protein